LVGEQELPTRRPSAAEEGPSEIAAHIASYLPLVESAGAAAAGGPAHGEFKHLLMSCVELLAQNAEHWAPPVADAVIASLLPALLALLSSENGDTRFLALKIFSEVTAVYLADRQIYDAAAADASSASSAPSSSSSSPSSSVVTSTKALNELLVLNFVGKCKAALADKEPIPQFALRSLCAMVAANATFVHVLQRFGLLPRVISFLQPDHANLSVHGVRLVLSVVRARDTDKVALMRAGLPERALSVLAAVARRPQASVDWLEPLVEMLQTMLAHAGFHVGDRLELGDEPWVDLAAFMHFFGRHAEAQRLGIPPLTVRT
jgi:hypothetical protein